MAKYSLFSYREQWRNVSHVTPLSVSRFPIMNAKVSKSRSSLFAWYVLKKNPNLKRKDKLCMTVCQDQAVSRAHRGTFIL